ncbi:diazepam-binding inhibitor-like 5 [Chrysoperla carnea]|uniref:diazepam-binding inhibitor-like 5 n=1 Tax=Chrysoperla carnea TaxID=189513 RepID=UPI001D0869F1|nr:diazepam-binding inhibitor-like 5 [Chrysoperla carnea]
MAEQFEECVQKALQLTNLEEKDMLLLYSLYQQATEGDCNTPAPEDEDALKQWTAWNEKKGMEQDTAKVEYVNKVTQLTGGA